MIKRRVGGFTLIELIISLFIVLGLLVVGFYSFNKFEKNSEVQKASAEIASAFETIHNYSLSLPIEIGSGIQDATYIGIKFNKNSADSTVKSYEYFYTKCPTSLINTYSDVTQPDPNCDQGNNIRIGEEHMLPKNIKILKYDNIISTYPLVLYNIKRSDIALWCSSDNCQATRETTIVEDLPVGSDEKHLNVKYFSASRTIKVNRYTGIVNERYL